LVRIGEGGEDKEEKKRLKRDASQVKNEGKLECSLNVLWEWSSGKLLGSSWGQLKG
jgi:hypothetical protein